ncbi:MAG: rRNA pseudouridine synthase [Kiritimatiellae bacterium]|nr:rRNA pseudouridine synthase [Kiritimatiellia bacterium]
MRTNCPKPRRAPDDSGATVRLQKFLADCGVASRRACEQLIARGIVTVDGRAVTQMGARIDPARQAVCVRGRRVLPQGRLYLALNKPRDVLCTSRDPRGRRTFLDLLPSVPARVYTVGRLDRDSEGLLLVTNDGDLAARLTHPRHHVLKTYRVWIEGVLGEDARARLVRGVESRGERLTAVEVRRVVGEDGCCEVVLAEGRNRQIRRMFEAVGLRVRRLKRTAIGPLSLGRLARGAWRELTAAEVAALRKAAGDERGSRVEGRGEEAPRGP